MKMFAAHWFIDDSYTGERRSLVNKFRPFQHLHIDFKVVLDTSML